MHIAYLVCGTLLYVCRALCGRDIQLEMLEGSAWSLFSGKDLTLGPGNGFIICT